MNMLHNESEQNEPLFDVQKCAFCGCTDDCACPGGCSWVAGDLCSRCAESLLSSLLCAECVNTCFSQVESYCAHCANTNCDGSCDIVDEPDDNPCEHWECVNKHFCLNALIIGYQLKEISQEE